MTAQEQSPRVVGAGAIASYAVARPSMGRGIIMGRQTEVKFINGMVADQVEAFGLSAPFNRALKQRAFQFYRQKIAISVQRANCLLENAPNALPAS